jgi:hypothetical protein
MTDSLAPHDNPDHNAFQFKSAAHLLRIGREKATNLHELLAGLQVCADDSIFQHTFRTLEEHHFIREGFSNDFAHWAFVECQEAALGEQFASADVREFTSIQQLRERLIQIVSTYLEQHPAAADRVALEPFYFCASETVVVPTPLVARSLPEFVDALKVVTVHSIHYHFIEARLRLKLVSNDFSVWLKTEMGQHQLADRIETIDIYACTLEDVRRKILQIVRGALA